MRGAGGVQSIDGLTSVERLCRDLRDLIHSARLLPGQEVAVRRLAAWRGVRYATLAQLLTGLERDGLLVSAAGTVRVAPLDAGELSSVFGLRRTLEAHLFERACAGLTEPELDRLDALAPHGMPSSPFLPAEFLRDLLEFHLGFFAPAASPVELRLLRQVHESSRRYHTLGLRAGAGADGAVSAAVRRRLGNHWLRHHALVATVRLGHVAAARELMRTITTDSEAVARRAFAAAPLRPAAWPSASEATA